MSNKVLIIRHQDIASLQITPSQCIEWVQESFCMKYEAQLPPKSSLHPQGDDFFNTMPCMLPQRMGRFAVKEVHRVHGAQPALGSDLLLYDSRNGQLLALMDADWITAMRTGAVAALAVRTLKRRGADTFSFVGLGNTAMAAALCLEADARQPITFRLLRYKDQAERFAQRFAGHEGVRCLLVDTMEELVAGGDVLISCLTAAPALLCPDDSLFRRGVLVVPVHTRGFQNCDLFFDKVFGDDTGHIQGFRYFSRFRQFAELSQVLLGQKPGRESDDERILSYNIGLGLHDAVFASKIFDRVDPASVLSFRQEKETRKLWV
ncbi:MAG: ornithine cyclodeaminase [Bacteroidaceae bacterium]|nr:ornithine cyclodeaminase [Bacteroidaceae bacterium]